MKCAIILLSLIAFSYSLPLTFGEGKQVTIDKEGTITIQGENGKKIIISRVIGHPGPKDIEIFVDGPNGFVKKIYFDDDNSKTVDIHYPTDVDEYETTYDENREKRSSKDTKESSKGNKKSKDTKSHADLLAEIFHQYQGVVDAKSYNDLLTKIDSYVKSGELNEAVYNVLRSFEEYRFAEKYGYQTPVDKYVKNQYPFNYYAAYPFYKQFFTSRAYSPYFGYRFGAYPAYRSFNEDATDFLKERESYTHPRDQIYSQQFNYEQPRDVFGEHTYTKPEDQDFEQYGRTYEQPRSSFYRPSSQAYEQFRETYEQPRSSFYGQSNQAFEQPRGTYEQSRGFYEQPKSSFYGQYSQEYEHPSESFGQYSQLHKYTPFQKQSTDKHLSFFHTM